VRVQVPPSVLKAFTRFLVKAFSFSRKTKKTIDIDGFL